MLTRSLTVAAVQAEPVWFDRSATVDKGIGIIEQAAANGAELIAFPENFVPGYPWHIWVDTPAAGMTHVPRYWDNAMAVGSLDFQRLGEAAGANSITVVMGYTEIDGGSLYMSQATWGPDGSLLNNRRKLKPTHVERAVFGEGDGADLSVVELDYGTVGALCCWEHLQPLSKYAMYSQGEDIHCASWPSFSVYRGAANALGPEVNNAASLMYAVEGQCFVVAPCAVIGQAGQDFFCDTEQKRQLLLQGGGFARIYGPEGSSLAEPLQETEEGILYATLEPALQAVAKSAADPVGHYSRPDVTRLLLNPTRVTPVVVVEDLADDESPVETLAE